MPACAPRRRASRRCHGGAGAHREEGPLQPPPSRAAGPAGGREPLQACAGMALLCRPHHDRDAAPQLRTGLRPDREGDSRRRYPRNPDPGAVGGPSTSRRQAATALGIATASELRDYFRLSPQEAQVAIRRSWTRDPDPVKVGSWPRAYLHRDASAAAPGSGAGASRAVRSADLGADAGRAPVRFQVSGSRSMFRGQAPARLLRPAVPVRDRPVARSISRPTERRLASSFTRGISSRTHRRPGGRARDGAATRARWLGLDGWRRTTTAGCREQRPWKPSLKTMATRPSAGAAPAGITLPLVVMAGPG